MYLKILYFHTETLLNLFSRAFVKRFNLKEIITILIIIINRYLLLHIINLSNVY